MHIPELNMEEWIYTVIDRVKQIKEYSDKVVIHISGASASGKTFSSLKLATRLENEGHKCLLFSTDNYYKGLSKMLAQKVNLNFYNSKLDSNDLAYVIREVIIDDDFDQKFSNKNIIELRKALTKAGYDQVDTLLSNLQIEFAKANFDEPDAVNILKVSEDINTFLKKDESVIIPEYSMITSEVEFDKKNTKYSNDYDVIIIEGIYSMNKDIIDNIKPSIQIKTFLDCDNKTLLVRRLKRDIIEKRSSMNPETNLYIALEVVIPSFEKYILDDKQRADFILLSNYTLLEARSPTNVSIQEKIRVSKEEVDEIMLFLNDYQLKEHKNEIDYYFANSYELDFEKQHLIRVRLEDKTLHSLVHKSLSEQRSDGKTIRPQQIFIKEFEFGEIYKSIEDLNKAFEKSHFHILFKIEKIRKKYWVGDVTFMVDRVDGLGYYVELCVYDRDNINQINELKEKLNLMNKDKAFSYFEEKANSIENENELKFLLNKMPVNIGVSENINQKYLKINNDIERLKIQNIIDKEIDWSKVQHVRIRKQDDEKFLLTLKGKGDISRYEIEKRLDFYSYNELSKFDIIGEISKQRSYLKLNKKLKMAIDLYKDGLIVGEVEYNLFDYSEKEIEKIVKRQFKYAKNITFDNKYKNFNLATKRRDVK